LCHSATQSQPIAIDAVTQRPLRPAVLSKGDGLARNWLDTLYVDVGTAEQIADELRACREQLGISYFVVFDDYMDAFAPVVARLAGS
jgi:hypothetical protein